MEIGFLGLGVAVVVWTERQGDTIRIISAAQAQNLVQLDPDVMKWFQSQGVKPTEMINTVLRRYIENNTRQSA
jgi:uncharacterized protein (DUF4415 family)